MMHFIFNDKIIINNKMKQLHRHPNILKENLLNRKNKGRSKGDSGVGGGRGGGGRKQEYRKT